MADENSTVTELRHARRKPTTVEEHIARAKAALAFSRSFTDAPPIHPELREVESIILEAAVYLSVDRTFPPEIPTNNGSASEADAAWARVKSDPRWVVWDALGTAAGNALDSRTPEELRRLDED
jgi:hypothetical protein